jgi:ubiquinone/menaquinone biosynthesis C-methylase UbiE
VWSNGRFEDVADNLRDMHAALVHVLAPQPGERWLDIACGAGHVAELAAGAGARVTGIDISPRLIEVAKARAAAGGYDIEYRVGDAENLDVEDGSVDAAASSVGLIFAPDHDAVARELARVVRPGGRMAFSAWTPEGSIGTMFKTLGPFQPPPPEGAGNPLQWGSEPYVREKLSSAFELRIERRTSRFENASVDEAWAEMSTKFGPMKTLLENLPPERGAELERAMRDYFGGSVQPDGRVVDDSEYLLVSGLRR